MASPAIYNQDYQLLAQNMLPVRKRKPRMIAWVYSLLSPLEWLHFMFFQIYANGINSKTYYDPLITYPKAALAIGSDNAVYYSNTVNLGVDPVSNNSIEDPDALWIRVCDDYRGVRERIKYTSQKMTLEFIVNKFFRLAFVQPQVVSGVQPSRPWIYIDTNLLNNNAFLVANDESVASAAQDVQNQNFVRNTYTFTGYAFTVFVPESGSSPSPGWYSSLAPAAEQKIRAVLDRYVIAGMTYDIQTY